MTLIRNAALVSIGVLLMLIGDAPPQAPFPFQIVSEANAIFGVWRRHARRWAIVGTAAVASSAAAASDDDDDAASDNDDDAVSDSDDDAASDSKTAAAKPQQQAAAAKHATAPAPAADGKRLPLGTVVPSRPAGCTSKPVGGIEYYYCGGNYYRAMFQGNTLVYVTVQPK